MPSRLPDRLMTRPTRARLVLSGAGRALRTICEGVFDEYGPLALAVEYGMAGFVIGVTVWLLFGLIWGIAVAVTVTGGLARRRVQ